MILETLDSNAVVESTASDVITFGPVHLDVTDGDRSLGFWRDLIGLELLGEPDPAIHLGAGGRELLVLHPGATSPTPRTYSGLYHLALHLPTLAEFARVTARVEAAGYPDFPVDHVTHLANYVDDPDGIGLELVFETAQRIQSVTQGPDGPEIIETDGHRSNGREPIDPAWLSSHVPEGDLQQPLPAGTVVGHLHLRVAGIDEALPFYRDQIGFIPGMYGGPSFGMADMTAGGTFPHRLAFNIWESAGAPQRPHGMAGLHHVTLVLRSESDLEAVRERLETAHTPIERSDGQIVAQDPAGNRLVISASPS
jgi:catechol 2,3-dioxygenase